MNKFGTQYFGNYDRGVIEKKVISPELVGQYSEIREVLKKLQAGYMERNVEKLDTFFEELFIDGRDTYVVGTGISELFLGSDMVKELISGDWEGWGDVNLDYENARIDLEGEVAWFAAVGSVKYIFEDSLEKYDRHINYIKDKIEEAGFTAKQKLAFINWFLTMVYHGREGKKREHLWPLRLSGVLLKVDGKWKFTHLKFSMPKPNFPDERFENDNEHLESYNKNNSIAEQYKNNKMTLELRNLLENLECKFIGQKNISEELVEKYFAKSFSPYIISAENNWYAEAQGIREFFTSYSASKLSLDLEHAIAAKSGDVTWVTVTGILEQNLTEDELAENVINELGELINTSRTSREKIFAVHRSVAYALKESTSGTHYTCPIMIDAVILNSSEGLVFHNIHFSYPFYWIVEGKLDE